MRVLGEIGYRRLFLLERRLDQPIPDITPRVPVTIDLLQKNEIDEYVSYRVLAEHGEVLERLNAGHLCFVVRHNGQIVHTAWTWANDGTASNSFLRQPVPLQPGDVYFYDSITHPDYRGLGLSPTRTTYMLKFMRQAGYKRVIAAIIPENHPSLRSAQKAGYRVFALWGYIKLGPWRRDFCRYRTVTHA